MCSAFAYQSPTTVACATPPGVGSNLRVVIVVVGQPSSSSVVYSYRSPVLTSIYPRYIFTTTRPNLIEDIYIYVRLISVAGFLFNFSIACCRAPIWDTLHRAFRPW